MSTTQCFSRTESAPQNNPFSHQATTMPEATAILQAAQTVLDRENSILKQGFTFMFNFPSIKNSMCYSSMCSERALFQRNTLDSSKVPFSGSKARAA